MTDFLGLCAERFSCRHFSPRPVDRQALIRCLEAARLAPSACNSQPWYFICVESEPLRSRVAGAAFSGAYSMNSFAASAGCLVCVLTERSSFAASTGGVLRGTQYNRIDLGLAAGQFILQAREEGLDTCLLGWFDEKAVKRLLGIPRAKKIDIIIALGYAEKPGRPKERKPLEQMARFT